MKNHLRDGSGSRFSREFWIFLTDAELPPEAVLQGSSEGWHLMVSTKWGGQSKTQFFLCFCAKTFSEPPRELLQERPQNRPPFILTVPNRVNQAVEAKILQESCAILGLRAVRQTGTAVTKTAVKTEPELSDGRVPAVAPVTAVAGSKLHILYIGPSIHLFNENVEDQSHSGHAERIDWTLNKSYRTGNGQISVTNWISTGMGDLGPAFPTIIVRDISAIHNIFVLETLIYGPTTKDDIEHQILPMCKHEVRLNNRLAETGSSTQFTKTQVWAQISVQLSCDLNFGGIKTFEVVWKVDLHIAFQEDQNGIALTPCNILAGGHIRTDAEEEM
ncbi:hypothetical protein DFH07DRAFT_946218 [Mycena maculata]|uniref:Uncharacterized protein n=1 Tax=Mycena maculata TaxID=230809 RepID=A0AAD7MPQ1_9AGAR|nr:hypothetical protein DFH07DRAFT_946218 [Mycena maculata]